MSYSNVTYKTPCPHCGGKVTWTAWGADCRGNDGGYIIDCGGCKARFTPEFWRERARLEIAERDVGYWRHQIETFGNTTSPSNLAIYRTRMRKAEERLAWLRAEPD